MPPARPRILADDSRSETSSTVTNLKDRANGAVGTVKGKKGVPSTLTNSMSVPKASVVNGVPAPTVGDSNHAGESEADVPHIDWTTLPISILHTYRAAYKLQTPSSYTQPHSDLIYDSCNIAHRAPSAVLARRKLRDLQIHRRKLAKLNVVGKGGHVMNGISKMSKAKSKSRNNLPSTYDSRTGSDKYNADHNGKPTDQTDLIVAPSIEPLSPATQSPDASSLSDQSSSIILPSTLNQSNPESTIIGRQTSSSLATAIRKHFNAQQLNEAETISRFTYVVRQQGSGIQHRSSKTYLQPQIYTSSNPVVGSAVGSVQPPASSLSALSKPYNLGGNHVLVEGSAGDGAGWIMGSMGREGRRSDSGGGGTFRLRFRP